MRRELDIGFARIDDASRAISERDFKLKTSAPTTEKGSDCTYKGNVISRLRCELVCQFFVKGN